MVAVEAVVRHDQHGHVLARQRQQSSEQRIVQAISSVDHFAVKLEVRVVETRHLRRVERHEIMANPVCRTVIDGGEIPRLVLQQISRRRVDGETLRQPDRQFVKAFVELLVDPRQVGHEQPQNLAVNVLRAHAQVGQRVREPRRGNGARRQRPPLAGMGCGRAVAVAHARAVEQRRGMGGEPPDDVRAAAARVEDVPHGPATPRRAGNRHGPTQFGIDFREPVHAVLEGPLARGDARPEHRREHGPDAGEVAHHAAVHEAFEHGHPPGVEQGLDDLPIRRVPAHEQDLAANRFGGGGHDRLPDYSREAFRRRRRAAAPAAPAMSSAVVEAGSGTAPAAMGLPLSS